MTEEIARRLAVIQERMAAACARSGRDPSQVVLVGASKSQSAAKILAAWRAGLRVVGENRVQEAVAKSQELPPTVEWHLIGHLQTNKVKPALELFSAIHSLDRPKLAVALSRQATARGRTIPCFLEINLGLEETKHGFSPEGLPDQVRPLADLPGLTILGLMAIPPLGPHAEASRPWFRRLRRLRDELAERPEWRNFPGLLSMGMSQDFEVAIEEGATHVRVGTALFGERPE